MRKATTQILVTALAAFFLMGSAYANIVFLNNTSTLPSTDTYHFVSVVSPERILGKSVQGLDLLFTTTDGNTLAPVGNGSLCSTTACLGGGLKNVTIAVPDQVCPMGNTLCATFGLVGKTVSWGYSKLILAPTTTTPTSSCFSGGPTNGSKCFEVEITSVRNVGGKPVFDTDFFSWGRPTASTDLGIEATNGELIESATVISTSGEGFEKLNPGKIGTPLIPVAAIGLPPIIHPPSVPEPSSLLMLCCGLLGFVPALRRKILS